ncbi:hypothetical protein GNI_010760 [Gregarina niphandrodes]|uniref:Uncharacterized protein n=1 Tax=Gregarina niphandrodes TaxID=110365 RepID=A0A023BCU6_GRENI|nr:hypothetical protein GNI_010760 [Gregarina niphandrodes]EZG86214.1 hypothetical protein GNI_010760 [Gregarina niphandrodes]|eukprot:XP_011128782.1 hypothetical protein GNI_010760 [Gregarina niphandrodes]
MLAVSLGRNLGALVKLQAALHGRTLFGSRLFLDHKFHAELVQPLQQEALCDTMDSLCNNVRYPYECLTNSPTWGPRGLSDAKSPVNWLTSDDCAGSGGITGAGGIAGVAEARLTEAGVANAGGIPATEYVSFGGERVLRNWKQLGGQETKAMGVNLVFGSRGFPHRSIGLFTFFDGLATPGAVRADAGLGVGVQLLPNVTVEAAIGTNLTPTQPGDEIKLWDIRARMH